MLGMSRVPFPSMPSATNNAGSSMTEGNVMPPDHIRTDVYAVRFRESMRKFGGTMQHPNHGKNTQYVNDKDELSLYRL